MSHPTDLQQAVVTENDIARFFAKVMKTDTCWTWTGGTTGHGYGSFWWNGKLIRAHRFAWIMKNGSIPDGLHVCHKCDNPPCVRDEHLFTGTMSDNINDAIAKGRVLTPQQRGVPPWQASLTECQRGHPYNEKNTRFMPDGPTSKRRCRVCDRENYMNGRQIMEKKIASLENDLATRDATITTLQGQVERLENGVLRCGHPSKWYAVDDDANDDCLGCRTQLLTAQLAQLQARDTEKETR